jgi:hypothetical protein
VAIGCELHCMALLIQWRDGGPGVRDHEVDCVARTGRLIDHPAALAVPERSDRQAWKPTDHPLDARQQITGLLLDARAPERACRFSDATLVERNDGVASVEQCGSDRREVATVVPIRRPRARMHDDHGLHRRGTRPERPGKYDAVALDVHILDGR